ncbi:hypothetical protein HYX16_00925 [Candidatus Woesearchaeota archaeon]|nr:hypothetical protein [Candidatus Woesearchaeota archaeon]
MKRIKAAYEKGKIYATIGENITLFELDFLDKDTYEEDCKRWKKQQIELELNYENMGFIEKLIFDLSYDLVTNGIDKFFEKLEDSPTVPFRVN